MQVAFVSSHANQLAGARLLAVWLKPLGDEVQVVHLKALYRRPIPCDNVEEIHAVRRQNPLLSYCVLGKRKVAWLRYLAKPVGLTVTNRAPLADEVEATPSGRLETQTLLPHPSTNVTLTKRTEFTDPASGSRTADRVVRRTRRKEMPMS